MYINVIHIKLSTGGISCFQSKHVKFIVIIQRPWCSKPANLGLPGGTLLSKPYFMGLHGHIIQVDRPKKASFFLRMKNICFLVQKTKRLWVMGSNMFKPQSCWFQNTHVLLLQSSSYCWCISTFLLVNPTRWLSRISPGLVLWFFARSSPRTTGVLRWAILWDTLWSFIT